MPYLKCCCQGVSFMMCNEARPQGSADASAHWNRPRVRLPGEHGSVPTRIGHARLLPCADTDVGHAMQVKSGPCECARNVVSARAVAPYRTGRSAAPIPAPLHRSACIGGCARMGTDASRPAALPCRLIGGAMLTCERSNVVAHGGLRSSAPHSPQVASFWIGLCTG
jgi:hypothetical protein